MSQLIVAAGTIERSTTALQTNGTTPVAFTEAVITLRNIGGANNDAAKGDTWTLQLGAATLSYTVQGTTRR